MTCPKTQTELEMGSVPNGTIDFKVLRDCNGYPVSFSSKASVLTQWWPAAHQNWGSPFHGADLWPGCGLPTRGCIPQSLLYPEGIILPLITNIMWGVWPQMDKKFSLFPLHHLLPDSEDTEAQGDTGAKDSRCPESSQGRKLPANRNTHRDSARTRKKPKLC